MHIDLSDPIVNKVLETLLAYLISLGAGLRTEAIGAKREKALRDQLETDVDALYAINTREKLKNQFDAVFADTAVLMQEFEVDDQREKALWQLFADAGFRSDFAEWLAHWEVPDPSDAESRLRVGMQKALESGGINAADAASCLSEFFQAAGSLVFEHAPPLAKWRHQLALAALGEQHEEMLALIRERHGEFTEERLSKALAKYRELALEQCDIIDLTELPEDRSIAVKDFLLRQLYIPLRIEMDDEAEPDAFLERLEESRQQARLDAAGRTIATPQATTNRVPIGELLKESRRLVVLGDPGGGKTTLMRWLATAFLLRSKEDPQLDQLPDITTLTADSKLPILVRCRELPKDVDCRGLEDILGHLISVIEVPSDLRPAMLVAMRRHLESGSALLMIDGLDELQDPQQRIRFCRRLEKFAALFPNATVIATSRIVGYREMHYRMAKAFRHGTIAELDAEEMDAFARRWVEATEPRAKHEQSAAELIENIHSSDRVERLARNPMLLTTLALVHRRIGRMPQKRHELYKEAIELLLNWRHDIDERLEWSEAIPQLQYVAYAMCERGVQRLKRYELLDLIEEMRAKYQQRLRDVGARTPDQFVYLLEKRSSILFQAGLVLEDGVEVPVYEFRHLTLQEYLAGLAMVDGRFPGHDRTVRIPQRVAKVAAETGNEDGQNEVVVVESWREPLRLCIACCQDDDVDDAICAVLGKGTEDERPRAIMAALCLADEPSVSQKVGRDVLKALAENVNSADAGQTPLNAAVGELTASIWADDMEQSFVAEFLRRGSSDENTSLGALAGRISVARDSAPSRLKETVLAGLASGDDLDAIRSALEVTHRAFSRAKGYESFSDRLISPMLEMTKKSEPVAAAGIWALGWLLREGDWKPTRNEIAELSQIHERHANSVFCQQWLAGIFGHAQSEDGISYLISSTQHESERVRYVAVWALGRIGRAADLQHLSKRLSDESVVVSQGAIAAISRIGGEEATNILEEHKTKTDETSAVFTEAVMHATDAPRNPRVASMFRPEVVQRLRAAGVAYRSGK